MSARAQPETQKRGAAAAEINGGPPAKRSSSNAVSMSGLQRELQMEIERRCRLEESVEQLRLELQLAGRLLAAAREQFVACGAPQAPHGVAIRTAPKPGPRAGRTKSDSKLVQRLQDELAESKEQCHRLGMQVEAQQQKQHVTMAVKKELLGVCTEMSDYITQCQRLG